MRPRVPEALAAFVVAALTTSGLWVEEPRRALDGFLFDRLAPVAGSGRVVAVAITPEDVGRFPRFGSVPGRWPWKRVAHAGLAHALATKGSSAIGFSLFFEHPGDPESDREFAGQLDRSRVPVLLAAYQGASQSPARDDARLASLDLGLAAAEAAGLDPLDFGEVHLPLPELAAAATGIGLVNLPVPGPELVRGIPLVYRAGPRLLPSLALLLVLAEAGIEPSEVRWEPGPVLVAGDLRVATTRSGLGLMRLAPVPQQGAGELLELLAGSPVPGPPYQGRMAVIGLDGPGLGSNHPTAEGRPLPSFQLEAAAAAALAEGRLVRPAAPASGVVLVFLGLGFGSLVPGRSRAGLGLRILATALVALGGSGLGLALGTFLSASAAVAGALTGGFLLALRPLVALLVEESAREAELSRAEELARSLLPDRLPPGVRGLVRPARGAAGDWFDAWEDPDGTRTAIVADVSGKGLDAAFLAGQIRAGFRTLVPTSTSASGLLEDLNRFLYEPLERSGRLATAAVVRVAPDGDLELAAAAHPALWVLAPDRAPRRIPAPGKPLGYAPDTRFRGVRLQLAGDETVCLVSDGVPPEAITGLGGAGPPEVDPERLLVRLAARAGDPTDDQTLVLVAPGRLPPRD